MNKISVPSPVFHGDYDGSKTLQSVYTLECQQDTPKGRRWDLINMLAHSQWLHSVRKRVITEKNTALKNKKKYAIVFASTQLRITRLHKYTFDPKAYLGRWSHKKDARLIWVNKMNFIFQRFIN